VQKIANNSTVVDNSVMGKHKDFATVTIYAIYIYIRKRVVFVIVIRKLFLIVRLALTK